jgi:hypothetical protein
LTGDEACSRRGNRVERSRSKAGREAGKDADRIKEVWTTNLEEEMSYLRAAIEKYPFVAMVSPDG